MSPLRFLREHTVFFLAECAAVLFAVFFLHSLALAPDAILYVALVFIAANSVVFLYGYLQRRAYYKSLLLTFESLEEKYLISELIEPAGFYDSVVFCGILRAANKSMNDKIARYRQLAADYREFIELWVHEIKTPIASARLTAENNPGQVARDMDEYLRKIEALVQRALYYARSNNVEKDYVIRELSLDRVVKGAVRRNAGALIRHKVKVETESLSHTAFADEKWLDFILDQLIDNAVKYKSAELLFSARDYGQGVSLSVRDAGIGIPARDLPRVFDKGFTGENGRQFAKATGMGLYLCKKLCGKMGLSISADSRGEGEGAVFTIGFPRGGAQYLSKM